MAEKTLSTPEVVAALVNQAKGFEKKGDVDKAAALYKEALKYDPKNKEAKEGLARIEARRLYLLGVEAYGKEDYETAIDYFEQALKHDPNNAKAQDGLARAQIKSQFGTEGGELVIGGATASGLAFALFSAIPYDENIRTTYLLGVEAYALNEDYEKAIALWSRIYDQLRDGDPSKKKLLSYINRARENLGFEPVSELETIEVVTSKSSTTKAEGEEKGPPVLETLHGAIYRTGKSYLNHTGLDGLASILGKIEEGSSVPRKNITNPGEWWQKYISKNVLNSSPDTIIYIGARKLGPDKWHMVFYNKSDDSFYLVTSARSDEKLEFSYKKLDSNDLANLGLKYKKNI